MPAIKRGLGGLVALALASCNAAAEPPRETPPKEAPRIARPTIERPAQRPVEPVMAPSVCKVAK
jgi:hypothetical protein